MKLSITQTFQNITESTPEVCPRQVQYVPLRYEHLCGNNIMNHRNTGYVQVRAESTMYWYVFGISAVNCTVYVEVCGQLLDSNASH